MRILVTGAAGFIGAHLCKDLIQKGADVTGIDSYSNYYPIEYKKKRVGSLLGKDLEIKSVDLSNQIEVNNLVANNQFDFIVHLAAQPGVRIPLKNQDVYVRDNLLGFANIATAAALFEVPNFFFASSSSVYGNDSEIPFKESELHLNPLSFYGATKLSNEILAKSLFLNTNTNVVSLRFFSVYGIWGRPDMAYFKLINSLLNQREFTIFGDGKKKRDFTYIDDVVDLINRIINIAAEIKKPQYTCLNVGGGNPYELNKVIEILEELAGKKVALVRNLDNSKDVDLTFADTNLQEKLVHFVPKVQLKDGLSDVWAWAKSNNSLISNL